MDKKILNILYLKCLSGLMYAFLISFSALASRCLQLIVLYMPLVRQHFTERLVNKNVNMLKHFDQIMKVSIFCNFIYLTLIHVTAILFG